MLKALPIRQRFFMGVVEWVAYLYLVSNLLALASVSWPIIC